MKKYVFYVILLGLVLLLTACSNPNGSYGPSWDVGIKLPLSASQQTTVAEMFEDMDGIDLTGDIVNYTTTEELDSIDIGTYLTDIDLPDSLNDNFVIPEGDIPYIDGFDIGVDTPYTFNQSIDISDVITTATGFDVQALIFNSGSLNLTIQPPAGSNIQIASFSVNVGGVIGGVESNNLNIYLTDKSIDFNGGSLNIDFEISIYGYNINYNPADVFSVGIGFSADTAIKSVEAVFNDVNSADVLSGFTNPVIDQSLLTFLQELDNELDTIEFNDIMIDLVIDNNTGDPDDPSSNGITADLSQTRLIAKDSSDTTLAEFNLGDIDLQSTTISKGINYISLVNSTAATDMISLIRNKPDNIEINTDFQIDSGGQGVVIDQSNSLGLSLNIDFGFDMTLTKDYKYAMEPYEVESLSQDDQDLLDNGLDSAKLVLTGLENQFPIDLGVYLYLASIDDGQNMTTEELENALYQATNQITNFEIKRENSKPSKEFVFVDQAILDKFKEDNLYFGLELILQQGDIVLSPGDSFSIDEVYTVLTTKVNG